MRTARLFVPNGCDDLVGRAEQSAFSEFGGELFRDIAGRQARIERLFDREANASIQARDRLIRKLIEEGAAAARSCRKDIMTATDIFQRLYDSEINASVAWIYDSGFRWRLGDDLNGWKASGYARTIDEAARLLAQAAAVNYPASEFAQWWAGA